MMRFVIGMLAAAWMAVSCHAEASCPFLNSATAGGILGFRVTVSVIARNNNDDAICEFNRESDDTPYVLRIEVKTMTNWRAEFPAILARCGFNSTALRGIGNEAIACSGNTKDGKPYAQVLSRVRGRALLVLVSTGEKHAAAATLREQSVKAAEEIAGNLF